MMIALALHLADSTLFALIIAVLCLCMRRRGPATRHALWLIAAAKFVLPMAFFSQLGESLRGLFPAGHVSHTVPALVLRWVAPSTIFAPPRSGDTDVLNLLLVVWFFGCVVMLIIWLPRLWRTPGFSESRDDPSQESLQRLAQRVGLRQAVTLRFSDSIAEPLLFGFRKPIVVLPTGLSGSLSSGELKSVILHELAHAKRRDNWTAAFSHVVTCIFWFYPLLWWIEQRLHRERELACDEMAVRYGAAPDDYVAGILKVCRLQLSEGVAGVSGVCRSNLKNRMEAIMSFSAEGMLTPAPKRLLGGLVAAVFLVPILVGFFAPMGTYGQNRRDSLTLPPEQASAIGCLRSIMAAEKYYSKVYRAGFSPTLASLGVPQKGMQASASAADLLTKSLTRGKKGTYIFTYTPGPKDLSGKITMYSVTARPITWKKGVRSFFAGQTGVIRWTDKNRAPRATDAPIN
jgi:beta-lactamase regulating signal transducer with metallopeptidase domain